MIILFKLGISVVITWIIISVKFYSFELFVQSLIFTMMLLVASFFGCFDILKSSAYLYLLFYFIILRIKKLKAKLQCLSESRLDSKKILRLSSELLSEHNSIVRQIHNYNKFWRKYILYIIFTLIPINLLYLNQILFVSGVDYYLYYAYGTFLSLSWCILIILSFFASRVSSGMQSIGLYLYKIQFCAEKCSFHETRTKIKLLSNFERMVNTNITIGFSVSTLFVMTHPLLYRV